MRLKISEYRNSQIDSYYMKLVFKLFIFLVTAICFEIRVNSIAGAISTVKNGHLLRRLYKEHEFVFDVCISYSRLDAGYFVITLYFVAIFRHYVDVIFIR